MSDLGDLLQGSPNFVNPQYATPEQLANLRRQAEFLQTPGKGQLEVKSWQAGLANALNQALGGFYQGQADRMQSRAASQNANMQAELFKQLQSGQPIDPTNLANIYANPMASPETRALATHLIQPEKIEDLYHRPANFSRLGGVQPAATQGNGYTPGNMIPMSTPDASTTVPTPGPPIQQQSVPTSAPPGSYRMPNPQAVQDWRNGTPLPPNTPPPSGPNGAPSGPMTIDQLAAKGRELRYQREQAGAVGDVMKQDVAAAADAPAIKRVAGVMLDDVMAHGDKMTFGPTAQWSNELKRVAANYAPGVMKDQLEALASADSFDKMSAQLTSMLTKSSGTDAQLFNNMKSVPGAHNSREGAIALLKMVNQVADQQQALREYASRAQNPAEYEAFRRQFFQNNPIVNPITGHPLAQDVASHAQAETGWQDLGGGVRIRQR